MAGPPARLDAAIVTDRSAGGLVVGCSNVRQMTQVRRAQNQAHVRMGDEPAAGVYDERNASRADLHLIDDVPDEPEVDLSDNDAGSPTLASKRYRQVRLGTAAEANGTVVRLALEGGEVVRILRSVDAGADLILREPADLDLLAAVVVDQSQLRDGRHLPEKPQRFQVTLLRVAAAPGAMRHPTQLRFDATNEIRDACRCRIGMGTVNSGEQQFLIAVGPPDVYGAADSEQQGHGASGQGQVLAKQTSARDLQLQKTIAAHVKELNGCNAIAAATRRKVNVMLHLRRNRKTFC